MTTTAYPPRGRSILRSTAVLLLIAGTGYVAGALMHGTFATRDASVAFAQPIRPAESNFRQPEPTSNAFTPRAFRVDAVDGRIRRSTARV
jgi:hypothetical protein